MLRGELGARRGLVAVGSVALAVLVACDPVPHPQFTVRESWNSGTELVLLSGYGNFAVVRASRQSATVPGAGRWRVDRRQGFESYLDIKSISVAASSSGMASGTG